MQDNEPLMRALSSLINLNHPDLVLFVGEALVSIRDSALPAVLRMHQHIAEYGTSDWKLSSSKLVSRSSFSCLQELRGDLHARPHPPSLPPHAHIRANPLLFEAPLMHHDCFGHPHPPS